MQWLRTTQPELEVGPLTSLVPRLRMHELYLCSSSVPSSRNTQQTSERTLPLIVRDDHKMSASKNILLMKIFGPQDG